MTVCRLLPITPAQYERPDDRGGSPAASSSMSSSISSASRCTPSSISPSTVQSHPSLQALTPIKTLRNAIKTQRKASNSPSSFGCLALFIYGLRDPSASGVFKGVSAKVGQGNKTFNISYLQNSRSNALCSQSTNSSSSREVSPVRSDRDWSLPDLVSLTEI